MRSVISPISSRNTVPRCAVSSLPGLSRYAPVKLPFTWPNSSDSSSVSGRPAQLTGAKTLPRARALRVNASGDDFLARPALAGDQHLGVGPRDAIDFFLERDDLGAASDQLDVRLDSHCRYCAHAILSSFTGW